MRDGAYRPASLATDGFVHCSAAAQVVETANRFFAGAHDLVVLCIDPDALHAPLRWEAAAGDPSEAPRAGLFPHLYGAMNLDAVVAVVPMPPGADGVFTLPARLVTR